MQQVLARHAALEAARAKTAATASLYATATASGAKDACHAFNGFLAQMDAVINAASPRTAPDPSGPTAEELAAFTRIAARARAADEHR